MILSDGISTDSLQWKVYYATKLLNNISFNQYDSSIAGAKIKVGIFQFTTDNSILQDLPYTVILRAGSFVSWKDQQTTFQKDISFSFFTKDADWPIITGVTQPENKDVSVYPNPCSNELRFSGLGEGNKVVLYDQFGKNAQLFFTDQDGKIDTSQLPNGLYIGVLSGGYKRFKVIKK